MVKLNCAEKPRVVCVVTCEVAIKGKMYVSTVYNLGIDVVWKKIVL